MREWDHSRAEQFSEYVSEVNKNANSKRTSSFKAFMIHSPPLLVGASRMIPTSANSAHTRKMGRCLVIRAASSFSRCSGAKADNAARDGALSAADKEATSAGVKEVENRLCRADMICEAGSAYTKEGR
jgi:hypothetical protein